VDVTLVVVSEPVVFEDDVEPGEGSSSCAEPLLETGGRTHGSAVFFVLHSIANTACAKSAR
jgi:hypothetical protein